MRRAGTLGLIGLALSGGIAAAQPQPGRGVELDPNAAGQPARLVIDVDPQEGGPPGEVPRSVTVALPRGLRVDTRARETLCTEAQAEADSCPESSKIGRGHSQVTVAGYLQPDDSFDVVSGIQAFLAAPSRPGDIAGLVFQVTELVSGQRSAARARVVPVPSGPYGAEIRFEDLPGQQFGGEPPPGVTVDFKRLVLFVKAYRKVTRKRKKRRRPRRISYHLLRNPKRCNGSWPYEVRVRFPSAELVRTGQIACTA